jgi:hypothetical protein
MMTRINLFHGGQIMISILIASLFAAPAHADVGLSVKVDSFVSTGRYTTAAEVCGHVEGGVTSTQQILIVTDPKSKGPGRYVAITLPTGEFCAVVATAFGQADVSIVGSTVKSVTVDCGAAK